MAIKTKEEVLDAVKQIISDLIGVEQDEVTLGTHLEGDLGMDDLDKVETEMAIEDQFDIELCDDDLERVATVGQLVDLIAKGVQ